MDVARDAKRLGPTKSEFQLGALCEFQDLGADKLGKGSQRPVGEPT